MNTCVMMTLVDADALSLTKFLTFTNSPHQRTVIQICCSRDERVSRVIVMDGVGVEVDLLFHQ